MKQQHTTLLIILVATVAAFGSIWVLTPAHYLSGGDQTSSAYQQAGWQVDDRCFQLDVANTHELRREGLSGRTQLESNEGMLFLYDTRGEYGFWMKDMNFPIDIVWLNDEDEIITIAADVSPDSYPETFYPAKKASKVIEIPAETAADLDLKIGDQLNLSDPTSTAPVDCAML